MKYSTKEECREVAKHYLENYIQNIPNEILHHIHSTHKVSSGWFNKVGFLFSIAKQKKYVNQSYEKRFYDYLRESEFMKRLPQKGDIEFTDNLLKEFIEELSM